jgi:hypothetical protein
MLASSLQTADRRKGRSRRVRTLQAGAATASGRGGSGSGNECRASRMLSSAHSPADHARDGARGRVLRRTPPVVVKHA